MERELLLLERTPQLRGIRHGSAAPTALNPSVGERIGPQPTGMRHGLDTQPDSSSSNTPEVPIIHSTDEYDRRMIRCGGQDLQGGARRYPLRIQAERDKPRVSHEARMQLTFSVNDHYVDSKVVLHRAQCVEHCAVGVNRDQTIRLSCHVCVLRGSVKDAN